MARRAAPSPHGGEFPQTPCLSPRSPRGAVGKWAQGPRKPVSQVILTSASARTGPNASLVTAPGGRRWPWLSTSPRGPLRSVLRTRLWSSCPTCTSPDPSALEALALSLVLSWQTFLSANYVLGPPSPPDPTSCQAPLRASGQWVAGCRSLSWRQNPMPCTGFVPGNGS